MLGGRTRRYPRGRRLRHGAREGSRKAIVAAFLANLGIAIAKFVGFLLTGAASLFAEALHSVADTGNQGLLFLGGARGKRRADTQHPVRLRPRALLLGLHRLDGAVHARWVVRGLRGRREVAAPHELESAEIAIGILLVAIVLEVFSLRTAVREANHLRGGESWWAFIRHSKSPELPVVLLEDLGALIGLAFALTGVTLSAVTDEPKYDAAGSLAIGSLLLVIAIVLAVETKSLLIGESAAPAMERDIRAAMTGSPDVQRLIHLKTLHLGPDELLVAAKVEVDGQTGQQIADAIDGIESRVRSSVPIARVIYIEPDVFHA